MMAVPAYITEANNLILQANNKDKLNELNESLLLYIAGVRTLINGAKQDTDDRRQHAVRRKIEKYIKKAEEVRIRIEETTPASEGQSVNPNVQINDQYPAMPNVSLDASHSNSHEHGVSTSDGITAITPGYMAGPQYSANDRGDPSSDSIYPDLRQ
eukprot:m.77049 g.77049  ORF g.77049 m.77049 type:complete len:156 (-) comp12598_c0_seq4:2312-2779(-)